eukprot:SAG11_NODE_45048_length_148_cov_174.448980_1_plen_35_part_01
MDGSSVYCIIVRTYYVYSYIQVAVFLSYGKVLLQT